MSRGWNRRFDDDGSVLTAVDLGVDPTCVTRFWMNVDRRGSEECWPWTGSFDANGYGELCVNGRMVGAHELAVTFTTGEIRLPELDTCHSCGNRPCCNPGHLRFDTRLSNCADTVRMGRCRNGKRRFSDEEVLLIRRRRAAGAAQQDLADQFGVSESLISQIVNGIKYPDVGGPILPRRTYFRKAC